MLKECSESDHWMTEWYNAKLNDLQDMKFEKQNILMSVQLKNRFRRMIASLKHSFIEMNFRTSDYILYIIWDYMRFCYDTFI